MHKSSHDSSASNLYPVRVGVGSWTFKPWRDNFSPKDLPHSQELEHASRQLTAIEVNGTYNSTLKTASFKRWAEETPDGFEAFLALLHRLGFKPAAA